MRLRLASLSGSAAQAVAWSVLAGVAIAIILPLALAVTGLVAASSDLSAARASQAGLAERIAGERDALEARIAMLQPSSGELAALDDAQLARTVFGQRMESVTRSLTEADVEMLRAGPLERDSLDEVWLETRFLLRLQGASDTILTLLSAPELADLDVVRFDMTARDPAGMVQLDIEFRLVSAGGSDDPAL